MVLIEKYALISQLRKQYNEFRMDTEQAEGFTEGFGYSIDSVLSAPEIDNVAQVIHGQWIFDGGNEYADHYHCSKCGAEIDICNEIYTEPTPNYCQNCGAKMDRETGQGGQLMDCEHCCGTCKWHIRETTYGDFICDSIQSNYYSDWTGYNDSCPEWEERLSGNGKNTHYFGCEGWEERYEHDL